MSSNENGNIYGNVAGYNERYDSYVSSSNGPSNNPNYDFNKGGRFMGGRSGSPSHTEKNYFNSSDHDNKWNSNAIVDNNGDNLNDNNNNRTDYNNHE